MNVKSTTDGGESKARFTGMMFLKKTWVLLVIYFIFSIVRAELVARDAVIPQWTILFDVGEVAIIALIGFSAFTLQRGEPAISIRWALFVWFGESMVLGVLYALDNAMRATVPVHIAFVSLVGLVTALIWFLPWALLGAVLGVGTAWVRTKVQARSS